MPLQKLQFTPGINKEGTDYSNEGGWYDCNNIRFRSGFPEKIGGWTLLNSTGQTYNGVCRSLWTWQDGDLGAGNFYIGVGTNSKYYIYANSVYNDITPYKYNGFPPAQVTDTAAIGNMLFGTIIIAPTGNLSFSSPNSVIVTPPTGTDLTTYSVGDSVTIYYGTVGTATTFTSGSLPSGIYTITAVSTTTFTISTTASITGSNTVPATIRHKNNSGYTTVTIVPTSSSNLGSVAIGDFVTLTATSFSTGTFPAGDYAVTSVSASSFTISTTASIAGSSTVATTIQYRISSGYSNVIPKAGWGSGPWGGNSSPSTGWGNNGNTSITTQLQLWSNDNFGADLVIAPRGGQIYYWTDSNGVGTPATYLENIANATPILTENNAGLIVNGGTTSTAPVLNQITVSYANSTSIYDHMVITNAVTGLAANTYVSSISGTVVSLSNTITSYSGAVSVTAATVASGATNSITLTVSSATGLTVGSWIIFASSATQIGSSGLFLSGTFLITGISGTSITVTGAATSNGSSGSYTSPPTISANYYTGPFAVSFSYAGAYVPNQTYQVISSAIQRFVIAFGANPYSPNNPNTTFDPMLIRWSDQENALQWIPTTTNQSGDQHLTNGSFIMGARATRQEILVWTDSCLYSMQYVGAPYVWGFNILMDNISIISPNCMVTAEGVTYWMGMGKFYQYSGRVETLPCSLRQYVFDNINYTSQYQVFAGLNNAFNEIWWFYSSVANTGVSPDKYIVYNYVDQVWYHGNMNRTAWVQYGLMGTTNTGNPMAAYANSTNNTANTILIHESGVDDVSTGTPAPIDAYCQSSDFDIDTGHEFGFVWRILPDVNFTGSNPVIYNNTTPPLPSVTMTITPRYNSGAVQGVADIPTVTSNQSYSPSNRYYTIQQFTGQVYTRLRARQMSFRIESNTLGTAWQLGTPRFDIRKDGRR